MDEKCTGLILRLRPLKETSLIIHWLTPECGRLATTAKGARRVKSPFRGKLDLLFEANIAFRRNRRTDLHTLTEVSLAKPHGLVRKDVAKLQLMAYATCFLEQATETETPILGIHTIFTTLLDHLAHTATRPAFVYALEMKLLYELGLAPALKESRLDDATVELLEQLAVRNWEDITKLNPVKSQVRAMNEFLAGFLAHNLGGLPKGREAALSA
ncbi:MAG: DNA repair protein RecO [Verrucomicrobiota bacterium]|jgi:DNA repair protein RecO (recombination protein O)|nr:DNA repair protein RecO [Verrucomicrobiota bacterium]